MDLPRTVAPVTTPADASMLTGLYPIRHAVRGNDELALPDEAVTLAEAAGIAPEAAFGVIPFGTGGDFRKTAHIPKDLARSARILARGKTRRIVDGKLYRIPLFGQLGAAFSEPGIEQGFE